MSFVALFIVAGFGLLLARHGIGCLGWPIIIVALIIYGFFN